MARVMLVIDSNGAPEEFAFDAEAWALGNRAQAAGDNGNPYTPQTPAFLSWRAGRRSQKVPTCQGCGFRDRFLHKVGCPNA